MSEAELVCRHFLVALFIASISSAFADPQPVCRVMLGLSSEPDSVYKTQVLQNFLADQTGHHFHRDCCLRSHPVNSKHAKCHRETITNDQVDQLFKLSSLFREAFLYDSKRRTLKHDVRISIRPPAIFRLFKHIESAWGSPWNSEQVNNRKIPELFRLVLRSGEVFNVEFTQVSFTSPTKLAIGSGKVNTPDGTYYFQEPKSGGQKKYWRSITWGDWVKVLPLGMENFKHARDYTREMEFLSHIMDAAPEVLPESLSNKPAESSLLRIPFLEYDSSLTRLDYAQISGNYFSAAFDILEQVAIILIKLQNLGISSGDVKPDNFVAKWGPPIQVKIIDFGMSYYSSHPPNTRSGTMDYTAPEVPLVPFKSDVFSLGIMTAIFLPFDQVNSRLKFPEFLRRFHKNKTAKKIGDFPYPVERDEDLQIEMEQEDENPRFNSLRQFVFRALDFDPNTRLSFKQYLDGLRILKKIFPLVSNATSSEQEVIGLYQGHPRFIGGSTAMRDCEQLKAAGHYYIFPEENDNIMTKGQFGLGICYVDNQRALHYKLLEADPKDKVTVELIIEFIKTIF